MTYTRQQGARRTMGINVPLRLMCDSRWYVAASKRARVAGSIPVQRVTQNEEDRRYFWTVNGTENCVFSHIILMIPPPPLFFSTDMVNWSTVLSVASFVRSVRPRSFFSSY